VITTRLWRINVLGIIFYEIEYTHNVDDDLRQSDACPLCFVPCIERKISRNADLGHNVLHGMSNAGSAIPLTCTCLKNMETEDRRTIIANVNEQ